MLPADDAEDDEAGGCGGGGGVAGGGRGCAIEERWLCFPPALDGRDGGAPLYCDWIADRLVLLPEDAPL